ncbi:hypothetical protein D3OALGA1CA_143 [Olavius algarvensis associated proteobacterium Delta 3]|nr:hypothetical protein D3OALGA1CA_143 [Olavius algarvensis associated proteobacterium Delta 3]
MKLLRSEIRSFTGRLRQDSCDRYLSLNIAGSSRKGRVFSSPLVGEAR